MAEFITGYCCDSGDLCGQLYRLVYSPGIISEAGVRWVGNTLTAIAIEWRFRVELGGGKEAEAPQENGETEIVEVARRRWWKAALPLLGLTISKGTRQLIQLHHWR